MTMTDPWFWLFWLTHGSGAIALLIEGFDWNDFRNSPWRTTTAVIALLCVWEIAVACHIFLLGLGVVHRKLRGQ